MAHMANGKKALKHKPKLNTAVVKKHAAAWVFFLSVDYHHPRAHRKIGF
jgi:hypothetical protein